MPFINAFIDPAEDRVVPIVFPLHRSLGNHLTFHQQYIHSLGPVQQILNKGLNRVDIFRWWSVSSMPLVLDSLDERSWPATINYRSWRVEGWTLSRVLCVWLFAGTIHYPSSAPTSKILYTMLVCYFFFSPHLINSRLELELWENSSLLQESLWHYCWQH